MKQNVMALCGGTGRKLLGEGAKNLTPFAKI